MRELTGTPDDVLRQAADEDELSYGSRERARARRPNTFPAVPADLVPQDGRDRDPQDRYYDS